MRAARTLIALAARFLEQARSSRAEREHVRQMAAKVRADYRARNGGKKPPEAGIAMPAVPLKGPLPKTGGAEAPLRFDETSGEV